MPTRALSLATIIGSDGALNLADVAGLHTVAGTGSYTDLINKPTIPSDALTFTGDASGSGTTGTTTSLTLANSGVSAGSYGSATNIPAITVDNKGRITSVTNTAVSIPSGSLTFTGDVTGSGTTGSSTSLTLASVGTAGTYTKVTTDAKGRVTSGTTLASSDLPTYTGTITSSQVTTALGFTPYNSTNPSGYITGNQTVTLSGDASGSGATAITVTLANSGVTAGTYNNVTVDAKGRVTSGSNTSYLTGTKVDSISATSPIVASASTGAITLSHANSGVTAGTYNNVTVNALGHVTSGSNASYLTTSGKAADSDLLDGQDSTGFLRLLSGGAEASIDSYTDNGFRAVSYTGHSKHMLSWNAGGSTGTVQQEFHYNTPANGWRIRNKTDNTNWSSWGNVVMASSNQGLISGTIYHSGNPPPYPAEADTLATVTGRGASTSTAITINNTITSSSTIQATNGRIALRDDSIENWATANDSAGIAVNYYGYSSGTSYYRDFTVYDGKGGLRFKTYGSGNYSYASGSMRAPIFYDSDDTNYYVNPASTSILSRLSLAGGAGGTNAGLTVTSIANSTGPIVAKSRNYTTVWSILPWGGGGTYISSGTYYDNGSWVHASSDSTNCLLFLKGSGPTWYSSNDDATTWNLASGASLWQNDGRWINNVTSPSDVRAPIFYDSDNTAYYADLSSTGDSIRAAGNIIAYYSDDRLKTKLGNITDALKKVNQLNGFYYQANELAQNLGYKPTMEVGVSAQEVEQVLPEIVKPAPIDQQYKTVDYSRLVPLLIEAVKELSQKLSKLEAKYGITS